MIRELCKDEAILSTPCDPATAEDAALAADLVEMLEADEDAACIAANQVGVTHAVVAYKDDNDAIHVMYNPKIRRAIGAFKTEETCLTQETASKVTRFQKIQVLYQELKDGELVDKKRDFNGWTAQIIQHMVDHCKGKLV